jgi:tRNA threonylcarbamoyladenosine biosynthesis protein TsaB
LNILLINSSDENAFAALFDGKELVISKSTDFKNNSSKKQPDNLISCLYEISSAHREKFEQTKAVAVTIGPGSFTGIRVGLAIAKGLADAREIPIIPLTNFELIYNRIPAVSKETNYCILIPAKLPEYYYSIWQNGNEIEKGCINIDQLSSISANNAVIVGNIDAEIIGKHSYFVSINLKELRPESDTMLKLALEYFTKGLAMKPEEIEPLYMKNFAAKKQS